MEADFRLNRARIGRKTLECALNGTKQPLLDKELKTRTIFKKHCYRFIKDGKRRGKEKHDGPKCRITWTYSLGLV